MSDGNTPADEWVTVPEAARRLGLSERQARRMVAKLPDTGRTYAGQGPDKGPLRVRMDLLHELRPNAADAGHAPPTTPDKAGQDAGQRPDRTPDNGGHADAALVAQLQSENAFLRQALEASNANTAAALAELSRAREQSQILIAATAAGRLQLSPQSEVSNGEFVEVRSKRDEPAQSELEQVGTENEPTATNTQERPQAAHAGETADADTLTGANVKPSPWWGRIWKRERE